MLPKVTPFDILLAIMGITLLLVERVYNALAVVVFDDYILFINIDT